MRRTNSKPGEGTLAILVSNYCVHLTTCFWSSWFLPLDRLFIFCFFMKLVALVSLIYFCVYFCQCRFYFQTGSTALFHSMVLDNMELFLCLYSLFVLLKRRLLFCDTLYCLLFPGPISDYNFSLSWHFYWVAPRICVLNCWLAPRYRYSLYFLLHMVMHSE